LAYYPDLTAYEYYPGEGHMLNVGWLSKEAVFPRGPVPMAFAHELELLTELPVELTRGCHVCEFCERSEELIKLIKEFPQYEAVWEMFRCGNGEIHVADGSGAIYCAPTLVLHYVSEHQYQPPREFVDAVLYHRELRCPRLA
jgi:hypothetical protein